MRTLQEELMKWKKVNKFQENKKTVFKRNKPKLEQLNDWEWKDLMGMNKPKYKRHRGAYRQR